VGHIWWNFEDCFWGRFGGIVKTVCGLWGRVGGIVKAMCGAELVEM
jgi:hypothetical protein